MRIPGNSPVTSELIMIHREDFRLYQSVEEVLGVRGIGPKTFKKLNHLLRQRVDIHV